MRSPFHMRGRLIWWRLRRLFDWAMPESSILVTSRFYDTREGIVSHMWHEILRLSPHLFWLGVFTHGAFLSAQDDDTGADGLTGWRYRRLFRRWYSRIAAFPSRGRCPTRADRVTMA